MGGAVRREAAVLVAEKDVARLIQPIGDLHCAVLAWARAIDLLYRQRFDSDAGLLECDVLPAGIVGPTARKNPMLDPTIARHTKLHGPFIGGVILALRRMHAEKFAALKAADVPHPMAEANRFYSKMGSSSGRAAIAWVIRAVRMAALVATGGLLALDIHKCRMPCRERGPGVLHRTTPIPLGTRGDTVLDVVLDCPETVAFMTEGPELFIVQLFLWAGPKSGWAPHTVMLYRGAVYDTDPTVGLAPLARWVDLPDTPSLVMVKGRPTPRIGSGPTARYGHINGILLARLSTGASLPMPASFRQPDAAGARQPAATTTPYHSVAPFVVESVLRCKICTKTGLKVALVRWRGYGDSHNTWEPAAEVPPHLLDSPEVKATVVRRRKDAQNRKKRARPNPVVPAK